MWMTFQLVHPSWPKEVLPGVWVNVPVGWWVDDWLWDNALRQSLPCFQTETKKKKTHRLCRCSAWHRVAVFSLFIVLSCFSPWRTYIMRILLITDMHTCNIIYSEKMLCKEIGIVCNYALLYADIIEFKLRCNSFQLVRTAKSRSGLKVGCWGPRWHNKVWNDLKQRCIMHCGLGATVGLYVHKRKSNQRTLFSLNVHNAWPWFQFDFNWDGGNKGKSPKMLHVVLILIYFHSWIYRECIGPWDLKSLSNQFVSWLNVYFTGG